MMRLALCLAAIVPGVLSLRSTPRMNLFSFAANLMPKGGNVLGKKAELLSAIAPLRRGADDAGQAEVLRLVAELVEAAPQAPTFPEAAEVVAGDWELLWTTEKETLFLLENGLLWQAGIGASQIIDFTANSINNIVSCENDSELRVVADFDVEDGTPRVNFEFKSAALKFRGFGVPVPPVGKGWFESVYVDEDLRIAQDSRGDTLIARRR
mmetsp:Transcript_12976/g.38773  ORF Transcript_12976/g.38773 Transcript_12976/m.38773 type:complete len:210 (-) Transcript_12976:183-812(-)